MKKLKHFFKTEAFYLVLHIILICIQVVFLFLMMRLKEDNEKLNEEFATMYMIKIEETLPIITEESTTEVYTVETEPVETEVQTESYEFTSTEDINIEIESDYLVCETNSETILTESNSDLCNEAIHYMAACLWAEARDQSELGKRLVIDCILNLSEYNQAPIIDVINVYFACVDTGYINEAKPSEELYRIIVEEMENKTNTEVLYFRTEHYHNFGTPLFQEGDHFFSGI